jgi:hypothetical protein
VSIKASVTFRAHGLVHVEYGLLAGLSEQPDGLRLCDLARVMNVSPSRLSHRMRKLADALSTVAEKLGVCLSAESTAPSVAS